MTVADWFALTVVGLQIAASIAYATTGRTSDAIIWFLYAAINVAIIFRERIG